MEFGNMYEVLQIGDRVEVNDICYAYYGRKGTIIGIKEIGPYTKPIYTIALDGAWTLDDDGQCHEIEVNASSLAKIPRKNIEEETITMGLRSCKTLYRNLKEFQDKRIGNADEMKNVDVKKIIFNGPKTIVLWSDGTKTIVSMSKDETNFDPEAAFCAAYTKKMFGTNSKIKRIIKEKSNIEQHQRIVEEKLKEELAKISQDYDKFMRELCPWLYTGEKLTEVDSACANAISDFYNKEFLKGKDDECLGKLCPCGDLENTKAEMEDEESSHPYPATEELAKIQDSNAKTLYETMLSLMRAINEDMEKNNGNN